MDFEIQERLVTNQTNNNNRTKLYSFIYILTLIFFFLQFVICFPEIIGILRIDDSFNADGSCNHTDIMGLNLEEFLKGVGIWMLIFWPFQAIFGFLFIRECKNKYFEIIFITFHILNLSFSITYYILGAMILYRSNMDCLINSTINGINLATRTQMLLVIHWLLILLYIFINFTINYLRKKNEG